MHPAVFPVVFSRLGRHCPTRADSAPSNGRPPQRNLRACARATQTRRRDKGATRRRAASSGVFSSRRYIARRAPLACASCSRRRVPRRFRASSRSFLAGSAPARVSHHAGRQGGAVKKKVATAEEIMRVEAGVKQKKRDRRGPLRRFLDRLPVWWRELNENNTSLYLFHERSRVRRAAWRLIRWKWFDRIVIAAIFINCAFLAMYDPLSPRGLVLESHAWTSPSSPSRSSSRWSFWSRSSLATSSRSWRVPQEPVVRPRLRHRHHGPHLLLRRPRGDGRRRER